MILYGADKDVADWVSQKICGLPSFFGPDAKAIGFVEDNRLICGVVYNNYRLTADGKPLCMEASIAAIDKKWSTRDNIRVIFAYPFVQLALERINLLTSIHNKRANRLASGLGFKIEGIHPKAYHDGTDAFSWGMLRADCRWLDHGKIQPFTSGSSGSGNNLGGADKIQSGDRALSGSA